MKCAKCNEREAVLFYKANINGEQTEKNLCAQCAQEEGFGSWMGQAFRGMPAHFFRSPFESPLGGYMTGGAFFPFFTRVLPAYMTAMPRIEVTVAPQGEGETGAAADTVPQEAPGVQVDAELNARRELNALRNQLQEAVRCEEFEKCAELRDKIRALEGK